MKLKAKFQIFVYVFFLICFVFFSCNSSHDPTITYNSGAKENGTPIQTPIDPTDYFSATEKQLETDSLNIDLRTSLAATYYSGKNYQMAIHHFSKVQQLDKNNFVVLVSLGNIYYDIQQYENAIVFYERALKIDDKNINVRCDLATCYLGINLSEKAIKILKENINMDYNHVQSHYNLSIAYKHIGKDKEAKEAMELYNKIIVSPR